MTKVVVKNGRGRPAMLANKKVLAKFLAVGDFTDMTNYMKNQLVDAGFLTTEKVVTGKRGRPAETILVTGRAKGLIAMSRNWKTAVAA